MNNFLQNSVFFGVFISIITYDRGIDQEKIKDRYF